MRAARSRSPRSRLNHSLIFTPRTQSRQCAKTVGALCTNGFFIQIEGVKTEKIIFTCVTFVFFTILVAVISYVKTKGDDQTTADGYFLAGRGLPGIVIAGSLLLTNLSAEQLVGTNGQT